PGGSVSGPGASVSGVGNASQKSARTGGAASDQWRWRWMISSDSHIIEPPNLWTGRVPDLLADRAPRVVVEDDGEWWFIDGRKTMSHLGIQTGARFAGGPDKLVTSSPLDQVRPAAYDPRAYLEENETDGVWGSVIYPSEGLVMFSVPNTEGVSASMKGYKAWLATLL